MNPILERNVDQLLARSWTRVRPSPGFEEALLADLLRRIEPAAAAPRAEAAVRPIWRVTLLAAAALLMVTGMTWLLRTRPLDSPLGESPSLAELTADGRVAWREGTEAPWHALAFSTKEIECSSGYLEVATPARRGVHVRLASGLVSLEPLTRARFGDDSGAMLAIPRVRLDGGGLRAQLEDVGEVGGGIVLDTSEGATRIRRGAVSAGILRASAASVRLADVDPARELVRLELRRGSEAHVSGVAGELPTEVALFLQAGRLLTAVAMPGAGSLVAAVRSPITEPGAEAPPVVREDTENRLPSILGSIVLADAPEAARAAGEPSEFVVWTLRAVPLPKVSAPEVYVFPAGEGDFSIQPAEAGRYRVFVEAQGRSMWRGEALIERGGADVHLEVQLIPGGAARGFVVDAQTGAPIAGALVFAEHDQPHQVIDTIGTELASFERMPRAHALTGAAGEFELSDLSPHRHVLRVSHASYAPTWSAEFTIAPATAGESAAHDLGTIELGHGGRVEGRVERPDGSSWEGAPIIVSRIEMERSLSAMTYGKAQADVDGSFAIEELPEGFYVAMNLGEMPNEEPGWSRVQQIAVRPGATTRVDFLAAVGRTRLYGVVRDSRGELVLNCNVAIAPATARGWSTWTVTPVDAEGRYTFDDLPPGGYGVFVNQNLETMTLVRRVEVAEHAAVAADLVLPPGEISGVVRDSRGTALRDVVLILQAYDDGEGSWSFIGKGNVDSRGRYDFSGLHPGKYVINVLGQDASLGALVSRELTITSAPLEKDFELQAGGAVVVRVKDAAGAPIVGARVRLARGGRECLYHPEPFTDSSGERSVFSLSAGRWTIIVQMPGYRHVEREMTVLAGERNELLVLLEER